MYPNIRNLREDKDMKQGAMANYLGINQATYSRYETGVFDVPGNILMKLAEFHCTSVDYLLGRTKNPQAYKD